MILWGLSTMAEDWQSVDTLTALCAVADDAIPEACQNTAATMFVWRVLWPLCWFGLLEYPGLEETSDGASQIRAVRPIPVVGRTAWGQSPGAD